MNTILASVIFTFFSSTQDAPMRDHFYVSSFYGPLKHCYIGESENICRKVIEGARVQIGNYQTGDHDYFKVLECSNDHDQVTVKTELHDDYSSEPIIQTSIFGGCE